ncbi:tRNA1(Val) (adenine(37)-N6)-methyltransferase [Roseobacter sinensis]|uniref:Methyltransferase domain-containing protein n=1 Tax=Roseobacter sinensis TaxID=2931391 RepID=A0ABT3BAN6_9RHOB|nr:methyltransferase domain-containing protein [Roseobacter sp. WL0113]MCV3270641.1 methyltransferase domain-containing protein [Roseobacter sp. WL0113]
MTDNLTRDAFLGGRVQLYQPRVGYRAGVDPVLLAASVAATPGQSVLDLGCGVGAAILCLSARVPGLSLTGVEVQEDYAMLARRNAGDRVEVITADISDLPLDLRQRQFDHVLTNPPYFNRAASRAAFDAGREAAHGESAPLAEWVRVAAKRLKPKGYAHIIHRAERLPEILGAWPGGMGSIEVLPLSARAGRMAERVIVRARKNGRGAFKLHAPLVLHLGACHTRDAEDYCPQVKAVLRDGAALEF